MNIKLIYSLFLTYFVFCSAISQDLTHAKNFSIENGISSSNVYSIYQDHIGYMWFGTDVGVSRFNGYEFENFAHKKPPFNSPVTKIWEEKHTISFTNMNNNFYSIINGEIIETSSKKNDTTLNKNHFDVSKNEKLKKNFENIEITSTFLDNKKGMWVTTLDDGIYYIPDHKFIETRPSNNKIYGLGVFNDNITYGYKTSTSLKIIDKPKFSEAEIHFHKNKLYYKKELIYTFNGNYINSSKKSKSRFIKQNKEFIYFIGDTNEIYKIDPIKKSQLVIKDHSLLNISSLGFNSNDELLIGNNNGIYNYTQKKHILLDPLNKNNNYKIISINSNLRNELIVATKSSGIFLKDKNNLFSKINNEKINSSYINALDLDKDDNIWIATNNGVYKINKNNSNIDLHFNNQNGLLSNQVNDIIFLNGKIYTAHNKGLSIININDYNSNGDSTNVTIPYIRYDNEKINNPSNEITIDSKYSYLTINYLAINYKLKGEVNYKYKINGIHNDWIFTKERKVQFTTLPEKGTYIFEVKAQNEHSIWGKTTKLKMRFLTPFYKSWWFIALIIFFSLISLWLITRAVYKRKLKMNRLLTEKLDFEAKALQSQMNPHFIFNALNSIQSFITVGDIMNSEIYLAKFSSLLRKTLNYSNHNTIILSKEVENLKIYLELETLRFEDRLNYEIIIDELVESDLIKIPPMLIQPFIENSIIHGLTPKPEGGKIKIHFYLKGENYLVCEIIDDGVGRQNKINSAHKSLGTSIVKKRLSLLSIEVPDYLKYTDLKDELGEPKGTKVKLTIPIK